MFKSWDQSERAYLALKNYYRNTIKKAVEKDSGYSLARKIGIDRSLITNAIKRDSFSSLRRIAEKIAELEKISPS